MIVRPAGRGGIFHEFPTKPLSCEYPRVESDLALTDIRSLYDGDGCAETSVKKKRGRVKIISCLIDPVLPQKKT